MPIRSAPSTGAVATFRSAGAILEDVTLPELDEATMSGFLCRP